MDYPKLIRRLMPEIIEANQAAQSKGEIAWPHIIGYANSIMLAIRELQKTKNNTHDLRDLKFNFNYLLKNESEELMEEFLKYGPSGLPTERMDRYKKYFATAVKELEDMLKELQV